MFGAKENTAEEKPLPSDEVNPEFPNKTQSGSGSGTAYSVEARRMYGHGTQINDQIFSDRWQRINFPQAPIGVRRGRIYHPYLELLNLYTYQSAQALRWWFHSELDHEHNDMCWETRLVEHEVKYTYESTATGAHEVMGNSDGLDRDTQSTGRPKILKQP